MFYTPKQNLIMLLNRVNDTVKFVEFAKEVNELLESYDNHKAMKLSKRMNNQAIKESITKAVYK